MHNNPVFSAVLTPYRSLNTNGIFWVVGLYVVLGAIPGLFFFFSGAWPILGFLGLDALVLWWALSASAQSGKAFEEVTLWRDKLHINSVSARGLQTAKTLNPFWVRLNVARDFEDRVTHIHVINKSVPDRFAKKHVLEVGAFLNPNDKTSFAMAFSRALARVKN